MTLKTSLAAALTPSTLLPTLGALSTGLLLMTMQTTSAQAAGQYYNCANPTGCKLVSSKHWTSSHTDTKYPIVLVHGANGFNRLFGVLDYFYGIPQALMNGGSNVFATKTSAIHNSEFRGEQLLQQVKIISAISGSPKVNLIGHSQGGIDIRYVAAVEPRYVASVTAISSPEQGSKTADVVIEELNLSETSLVSKALLPIFELLGGSLDIGSGIRVQEQDGWQTLQALSAKGSAPFNAKFPAAMPTSYCGQPADIEVNGIKYYSFSGVGQITNGLDPSDYLLATTGLAFAGEPNDGLVSSCSSRLGYVIRDNYKMNHLDSVNQVVGLTAWGQPNPKSLYSTQVNRLKKASL